MAVKRSLYLSPWQFDRVQRKLAECTKFNPQGEYFDSAEFEAYVMRTFGLEPGVQYDIVVEP